MGQAIGDVVPFAVGVAISPIPVLALILMLFTPKARTVAPAFALGWVIGLGAVSTIALFLGGALTPSAGGSSGSMDTIKIVLGAVLILAGIRRWRKRPHAGVAPKQPKWMDTVETTGPGRAVVLGAALSGVNPKNLILGLAAGAAIAQTKISGTEKGIALAVYVALGSITILALLFCFLALGQRARDALQGWKNWLGANSSVVVAVVMVVLGAVLVGKGIAGR